MEVEDFSAGSDREPAQQSDSRNDRETGLADILLRANHVIVTVSLYGEILEVSENVTSLFGFQPTELVGDDIVARVHPADRRRAQQQFARNAGRAVCRHADARGSWRWIEVHGGQSSTATGQASRTLVVRDVTTPKTIEFEAQALQEDLDRYAQLASLGIVAGGVAHDFNNLLTVIAAHASMARDTSTNSTVNESLDQILRASKRAQQLTEQVLAFRRRQLQEQQQTDLAALVREALALLAPVVPARIRIKSDLCKDAGVMRAHPAQIHQLIINLCMNAVHAIGDDRGELCVHLQRATAAHVPADVKAETPSSWYLCLTISDTGHGMTPEVQQRIFEPFFTTKAPGKGTGLGLAIVRRIVREHRAAIRLQSAPNEGAKFTIFFPVPPSSLSL